MLQNKKVNPKIKQEKSSEEFDPILAALIKRAAGYKAVDEVEEYTYTREGEKQLTKHKITTYEIPPDMTAIKLLLEERKRDETAELTEEELLAERDRLLRLLFQDAVNVKKPS